MDGMQAKVSNLPWLHPYNPSLQSEPMPVEQWKNSAVKKCVQPLINTLQLENNFGTSDPIGNQLPKLFQALTKNPRINVDFVNSMISLITKINGGSEDLVMSQQDNVLMHLLQDIFAFVGKKFPLLQHLSNIVQLARKTVSLNNEDKILLNNSLTYLAEYFSSTDAMKNVLKSATTAIFKYLTTGEELSAVDLFNPLMELIAANPSLNNFIGSTRAVDKDTDIRERILTTTPGLFNRIIKNFAQDINDYRLSECLDVFKEILTYYNLWDN